MYCCCFQLDSSALLDVAVRNLPTPAEQEAKVSPTAVSKTKKTPSITSKLKSPAPVGRAKKLSLDKTAAEKGATLIPISFLHSLLFATISYYFVCCRFFILGVMLLPMIFVYLPCTLFFNK